MIPSEPDLEQVELSIRRYVLRRNMRVILEGRLIRSIIVGQTTCGVPLEEKVFLMKVIFGRKRVRVQRFTAPFGVAQGFRQGPRFPGKPGFRGAVSSNFRETSVAPKQARS